MRLKYLALASLVMPLAPAVAQEAKEDEVIVVTGRGLEAPPSVIAYSTIELDREQMLSTASGQIEDALGNIAGFQQDRKSTRLNSSHVKISYAVFCLKKKNRGIGVSGVDHN